MFRDFFTHNCLLFEIFEANAVGGVSEMLWGIPFDLMMMMLLMMMLLSLTMFILMLLWLSGCDARKVQKRNACCGWMFIFHFSP